MDTDLNKAIENAISMLNTVAECASHECIDCREYCAKRRDELKYAYTHISIPKAETSP